jgi:hypothetical protein
MFLSPSQIFGEAEHLARQPTIALATREVGAFNKTGMDRLTDDGRGQTHVHRCFRAEDDPGGHLYHTPAFPACDDLDFLPFVKAKGEVFTSLLTDGVSR